MIIEFIEKSKNKCQLLIHLKKEKSSNSKNNIRIY